MTEAAVRNRVMLFADGESEPVLTTAVMEVIIESCKIIDVDGIWPSETGWTPTYNVSYAIAQAWLYKMGNLAPRYLFMTGGKMLSRQQYFDHTEKMMNKYLMRSGVRSHRLGGTTFGLGLVPNNANV